MDERLQNLDWALLQAFLAVAECGSLSGAARQTGQSQPTLGRQIKAVESALGNSLFTRQPKGLVLNDIGLALLPMVHDMQAAARRLSLAAAGQNASLKGVVRITASVFFAHYSLPPIIAKIRHAEPDIQIEIAPTDSTENLLFREADIAIRMYRPVQEDVIARKLGALKTGLFASRDYLAARGGPTSLHDMQHHDFVGFDRDTQIIDGMNALGLMASRETFALRCDNHPVYWQLVRAGCGIGATQVHVGAQDPDIVQIMPELPLQSLEVWLAAPSALRGTPRIRRVYDLLAEMIIPLCDT